MKVETLRATHNPQNLCALAMHNDYSEKYIGDEPNWLLKPEEECGKLLVDKCLKFGHFGVCYDKETEVLTKNGFKLWPEITENDELLAVNIYNNTSEYEKPINLIKLHFEGDLIGIDHRRINLLVTPDHKVVTKRRIGNGGSKGYGDMSFELMKDIEYVQLKMVGATNIPNRINSNFTLNELKLIGFWIGDGIKNDNKIRFRLRKDRKINWLNNLGFDIKSQSGERYVIENLPSLKSKWLNNNCLSEDNKKTFPDSFLRLTPLEVDAFLEGLSQSDGKHRHKKKKNCFIFCNTSLELINKLHHLVSINNLAGRITKRVFTNPNHNDLYELAIHPNQEFRIEGDQYYREYYEGFVYCAKVSTGALLIRRNGVTTISGNCEHAQITIGFKGFPHSVMQQLRTHRTGCTFDVQSTRYTGKRFLSWYNKHQNNFYSDQSYKGFEELFYMRPVGEYADRFGHKIDFNEQIRKSLLRKELLYFIDFIENYMIKSNIPFEMARDHYFAGYRQNFVMSANARTCMHLLDLRLPKNAQLEINIAMEGLLEQCKIWMPEVFNWYEEKRARKNKIAP